MQCCHSARRFWRLRVPLAAVKCSLLRARKPRGPGPDRDPQGAARCWAWVSRGSCQPLGRGTGALQAVLWAEGPRPHRCSSAGGSESSCAPSSAEAQLGLGAWPPPWPPFPSSSRIPSPWSPCFLPGMVRAVQQTSCSVQLRLAIRWLSWSLWSPWTSGSVPSALAPFNRISAPSLL